MKENRWNKSYNTRLTRWIDRLLPFQFDIEHLPGAKMGLVGYISRHPFQKAKNVSTKFTPIIKAHDPASQITPKNEANNKAINLISTHAAQVYKHDYYNSPAPRKLASNTNCNLNSLKYADSASQIPLHTYLAKRNTNKHKQLFQNRNELALASREIQIIQSKIPPIRRHSTKKKF